MKRFLCLVVTCLLAATPAFAQISYPPLTADLSSYARTTDLAAMAAQIPTPAAVAPPCVADSGTAGTDTTIYALRNHTHCSKARKDRVLVSTSGIYDVAFALPFTTPPLCTVTAEATLGDTNVVNAQMDGRPTATGLRIRVNRTASVVVLTVPVLGVQTPVATYAHYICVEP